MTSVPIPAPEIPLALITDPNSTNYTRMALDAFDECFVDPDAQEYKRAIPLLQYAVRESIYGNPHAFWVVDELCQKKPSVDQWCVLLNTSDFDRLFERPENHCKEVVNQINVAFAYAFNDAPLDVFMNVSSEDQHCLPWLLYLKKYGYNTSTYAKKTKEIINAEKMISDEDLQWYAAIVLNTNVPLKHHQGQIDRIINSWNLTYSPEQFRTTQTKLCFDIDRSNPMHSYWNDLLLQSDMRFEALIEADRRNAALDKSSHRLLQWSEWIPQLLAPKPFNANDVLQLEIALRAIDVLSLDEKPTTILGNVLKNWVSSDLYTTLHQHLHIYKNITPTMNYAELARVVSKNYTIQSLVPIPEAIDTPLP